MSYRTLIRLCTWSAVIAGGLLFASPTSVNAGGKKGGVYRLDHVVVGRGYNNFGKEDKALTSLKEEIIKGRPGKIEVAGSLSWYTHKMELTVDAPETVTEGQEFAVTASVLSTFNLKEKSGSNAPYTRMGLGNQWDEGQIIDVSKNPWLPGVHTMKASKSRTVRVGPDAPVLYTYRANGAGWAKFTIDARSALTSQLTLSVYYHYRLDETATPQPQPQPDKIDIAVRGDAVAGEPVTVVATVNAGLVGKILKLELPNDVELVAGPLEQKVPVNGIVTWQIRGGSHGPHVVRIHLGGQTHIHTINIRAAQVITKLPELPINIQQQLKLLQQQAQTNNWSFQIGQTGVSQYQLSQLCSFRVPDELKIEFNGFVQQVNQRGRQWLETERRVRDEFNRRQPDVLTELRIDARTQVDVFAKKGRFDWRDYNKVTPVTSQGGCGSCWAFAAIGAFECSHLIRNDATIRGSEQQALDCSFAGNCVGGWHMDVFKYLIQRGGCPGSAYPYVGKQNSVCNAAPSPYKAISWGFVAPDGRTPSVAALKTALCQHGPVAVVLHITDAFKHYKGGIFNQHVPPTKETHVVLIVGWDDSKGKNGCWAIRNSWDTTWGEQGFGWIEYGCNGIGDYAAWVEAQSMRYSVMTLLANDYKVAQNLDIYVPLHLLNPINVKNMDFTLDYDANVVKLIEPTVVEGNLPLLAFRANPGNPGSVLLSFAQDAPIKTTGQLARLHFKAIGAPGSRTPLTLMVSRVDDPAGQRLPIKLDHGSIEIVKERTLIPRGSCCGQERLVLEDALCALEMSVRLREENLNMDMDNSGRVDSRDAAIIVQMVTDQARTGQ